MPTQAPEQSTDATQVDSVVIRFCGDSGDGMQLAGGQFTSTSAAFGNDISTFPDFPAEIRAPHGTTFGVSGFQLQFSSSPIHTAGDMVNALVAMNPAGFRVNIGEVEAGGIVIVNEDEFEGPQLKKCGYPADYNPIVDAEMNSRYRIVRVPMTRLTRESLAESGMGAKDVDRCRNMFALGLVYWLYQRPLETTMQYLESYFGKAKKKPELAEANIRALKAGFYLGETAELFPARYAVPPAKLPPGTYRRISGNEAMVLGLAAVTLKANKQLLYASYPITPASDILHGLARLKHLGVKTFQAEDEIAAVCAAIGASYAGDIGVTGTSGPGLALKSEAIGLAVMLELPLIVIDVQRAGPSTGMPTKTEQGDLLQAFFGRPGECPCIVLAPSTPSDCFNMAIEAVRLAVRQMCPVIILSDGHIANGAEPWRVPEVDSIPPIEINHPKNAYDPELGFRPYIRDSNSFARSWALPGTPGLEHRIGSLEKMEQTGAVCYDPDNHEKMTRQRAEKVQRAAQTIPPLEVNGPAQGDVLLLGWGSTYGAITAAASNLCKMGHQVSTAHLRYLNPFPSNLESVLSAFKTIVIPEINFGQLCPLIRARFLVNAISINEVKGRMFRVKELTDHVLEIIDQ